MNMTNSERRCTSVPRETNGQDQTTPEHVDLVSCHCLHCKSLKFVLGIPKSSKDETFISTDSSKLGTGTPTFGTRFHHICTMLYQVPPLWYHGTTTLSPPSKKEIFSFYYFLALALKAVVSHKKKRAPLQPFFIEVKRSRKSILKKLAWTCPLQSSQR